MFGAIFLRVASLATLEVKFRKGKTDLVCDHTHFSQIILGQPSYRKNAVPNTFHSVCAHLYLLVFPEIFEATGTRTDAQTKWFCDAVTAFLIYCLF